MLIMLNFWASFSQYTIKHCTKNSDKAEKCCEEKNYDYLSSKPKNVNNEGMALNKNSVELSTKR